ncbi:MAG: molybdopterin molybdenumtransferase MoeA, partial [Planktomarina sp.]
RKMLGMTDIYPQPQTAVLTHDLPKGGPRQHYMRAVVKGGEITVFDRQDSALLTVLSGANALAVRPPNAPSETAGTRIEYLKM